MFDDFLFGALAARERHPFPDAPLTLIGVQSLFDPSHLIEIEAVAVADDRLQVFEIEAGQARMWPSSMRIVRSA